MKLRFLFLTIIILSSLGFCSQNNTIYHIPINGTIDMGLPYYIKREINNAEENKKTNIAIALSKLFIFILPRIKQLNPGLNLMLLIGNRNYLFFL